MKKTPSATRKAAPQRKATPAKSRPRAAQAAPAAREAQAPPATPPAAIPAAATPPAPRAMARVPMTVRWDDLDAFNHVNNATFLVYAQEARLAWLADIKGTWFDETMMPVVAAAQVNFRRQLAWPARIAVELAATRVGASSVTLAHRILAEADAACVYADGEVVMVWVDPASGRPVALPEAIRDACTPANALPGQGTG
mgnify:CR=1 FL=1